ncbi:MAG: GNAT family N-acetyltransferase [Tannerella sp.]|jgi:ribosomal protein S18 acetylase RimI-like enzyme|nr:GNAT family N-acetyltransferase [Tannerella sp.]
MNIHRISERNDQWYTDFLSFYTDSFPIYEQRNEEQQIHALRDDRYHLDCYIEDSRLLAFIAYWDFRTYCYIEHLAVHPHWRGRSIGKKVLLRFMNDYSPYVLLEIDPVIDDISAKRFRFYQQLGFVENPYSHFHPAYDQHFEPHQLTVLSAPDVISQDEYKQFQNDLEKIVMNKC